MPFSLIWLPEALRGAGLKVELVDGWEDRGRGDVGKISGVICHHTAGGRQGNIPSLNLLVRGRPAAPGVTALSGPLSQLALGRDGTYFVIAAGRANHAGAGIWQRLTNGNANFIGIEAENTGGANDFPWPEAQMDAYRRGVAAILRHVGQPADFCCGHKEYALPAGRKRDPTFDMDQFRAGVAAILNQPVVDTRPTLRRGDRGALVARVQAKLGVAAGGAVGVFGPRTEEAVKAFQRRMRLGADGVVGPRTWAALDSLP